MSEPNLPPTSQSETPQETLSAVTVTSSELVGPAPEVRKVVGPAPEVPPIESEQAQLVSAADLVQPEAKTSYKLPPVKGKGNRTLDDYRKLDWSKTNSQLAKECGVTRQRIAQIREELKLKPEGKTREHVAEQVNPVGESEIGSVSEVNQPAAEPPIAKATDYKLLAETTFDMGTGLLCMTLGPEWQPRILEGPNGMKYNEREVCCGALQKYFEAKQVEDLPPGVMLTFVLCSYAGPRLAEKNTKNKLSLAWNWCKVKLGGLLKRKKKTSTTSVATNNEN